jgi:PhnB protein
MLGKESAKGCETRAPATSGTPSPVTMYVYCPDVDALYDRATGAGATGLVAPNDTFWGDRMCRLADPDGHSWCFATSRAGCAAA